MPSYPQFKRYFRYEILPHEGVFLLSEMGNYLLRGSVYTEIAPYLTGTYSEEEIAEQVQEKVAPAQVFYALTMLKNQGYITSGNGTGTELDRSTQAYWDLTAVKSQVVQERLASAIVTVHTVGEVDVSMLLDGLQANGLQVGENGTHHIVVVDDYLQPDIAALNETFLSTETSWLLLKPVGGEVWLGPLFVPEETGCWSCLAHRLQGHRKVNHYLATQLQTTEPFATAIGALPSTLQLAYATIVTEINKWIVFGENARLQGQVVTINTLALAQNVHILCKRPQCTICGDFALVSQQQKSPLQLQAQPKHFTADGGHRAVTPEETYAKYQHHISPITGLVTGMVQNAHQNHKNNMFYSYVTDHNFVHMSQNLFFLRASLRSHSGGKGRTDIQARTSALCESIERYSGVYHGDEAKKRATMADLGDLAIDPRTCLQYSDQQYAQRQQWNQLGEMFAFVSDPFVETEAIDWSPVWSLTNEVMRYVPTSFCYYGYSWATDASQFARADSNGCASGNTKEEAILQGFMELIERDSVAIWWGNRLQYPAVDLHAFSEPYFAQLQAYYREYHQREIWVIDITTDLGIPSFAAISRRLEGQSEDIIFGFGTHFDPKIGIQRALTEHTQMLPNIPHAPPEQRAPGLITTWLNQATIANQPYVYPHPDLPPKQAQDYQVQWQDDIYDDVKRCVQMMADEGMEVLILDQTRPDTEMHVLKVIVPGLRHFWARYAPGRLYDAPIKMGLRDSRITEEDLNPYLMFL